jgi:hypothetical protein
MVRFGAISKSLIRSAKIGDMKSRFLDAHNSMVFNQVDSSEISRSDAERLQIITKEYEVENRDGFSPAQIQLLQVCEAKITEIAREILGDEVPLKTIESVQAQK